MMMMSSGEVAMRMVSACNAADWHVAESLLDLYGAEAAHVRGIGDYDSTPLHAAAATGQLPLLHQLLRVGAVVDAPALHNFTALFMAVRNNRPAAAAVLLAAGADPDLRAAGTCPLLVAADAGFAPVVAALLRAGASVFVVDHRGDTALHLACANSFPNVAQMLLDAGAQPHTPNALGLTPLQIAEHAADLDLVQLLTTPTMALTVSDPAAAAAAAAAALTPYHSDMYALDKYPYASSDALALTPYAPSAAYALHEYGPYNALTPYSSSRYYSSAYGPYALDPYSRSTIDRYGLDRSWPLSRLGSDALAMHRYSSAFGRYGLVDSYYNSRSSAMARYSRYGPFADPYSRSALSPYDMRYGHGYGYGYGNGYGYGYGYGNGYDAYGRYSMYDRIASRYDPYYQSYYHRSRSLRSPSDWDDDWHSPEYDDEYHNRASYMSPYWRGRSRLSSRERYRMSSYRSDDLAEIIGSFVCRAMSHSQRNRFMSRVQRNAHRYRISGSTLLSDRYGADTLARMLVTDSSGSCRGEDLWATAEFIRSFRAGGSYAY